MQLTAKILALLALGLTAIPPLIFMFHSIAETTMKALMIAGTILWFVAAPLWLKGGSD